jgi:hypothetical protein
MQHLLKYNNFNKINESEMVGIPANLTNLFEKTPKEIESEYEKQLGHKGHLSEYFRQTGRVFTFGVLKNIFKDAVAYKKKRELVKGTYKMIHRAVPMTLAFISFPIWLAGNVLGASRALNKILEPILQNPENNYNEFLVKLLKGTMAFMEGEIKYVMGDDWFYTAFVMEDDLIKMVRKDVLRLFAIELANKMEQEPDDKPVPHHYIENQLKIYLNEKFDISPPMELKSSKPKKKK